MTISFANKKIEQESRSTPMMRQYHSIKSQYPDAILFYRLGDFYEMFYDDAVEASRLLNLTLTTRNKNSADPVPLCGVPHHTAQNYISRLIRFGKKVVVCDQVEDPKLAKGIVKREVTRVVTPGVVLDEDTLSARANNFLLAVFKSQSGQTPSYCLAICDVSTGRLEYLTLPSWGCVLDEIARLSARELIYPAAQDFQAEMKGLGSLSDHLYSHDVDGFCADPDHAVDLITQYYGVHSLEVLDLSDRSDSTRALGMILGYLKENKLLAPGLLAHPRLRDTEKHVILDEAATRTLELFKTMREDRHHGSLLWHLDFCQTGMGSRLLADFVRFPLLDLEQITRRHDAVEELVAKEAKLAALRNALSHMPDLERLANRFVAGSANARDAAALKEGLARLVPLQGCLSDCECSLLRDLSREIFDFSSLVEKISETLVDEPPLAVTEGGLIRCGVHQELDELRGIETEGKQFIAALEAKEKERTNIPSLKIGFNNVFGYYIEVTHTHKDKVPASYVRKQTLTHAERYITDELRQYEEKVLHAGERTRVLEHEIFCQLRDDIRDEALKIKRTAASAAALDVLQAFASLAVKYRYVRPRLTGDRVLELKQARHPVLERLQISGRFVPNDVVLNGNERRMLVITGPNMAGKSTIMRMTATIVLMAQMGCFVPCEEACIGVCDRVFTRVGAHDFLQKGLSTFMVEMIETARILRQATERSLILLDEIGRGTSTFDGLSIAWAVTEDICDRIRARTLFATHYHELCDLARHRGGIQNAHMAVREHRGEIIFLHSLAPGSTNRSYGVAVAAMAGMPADTVARAREIMALLEKKDISFQSELNEKAGGQMSLFEKKQERLAARLDQIDVDHTTPMQALAYLAELKKDAG